MAPAVNYAHKVWARAALLWPARDVQAHKVDLEFDRSSQKADLWKWHWASGEWLNIQTPEQTGTRQIKRLALSYKENMFTTSSKGFAVFMQASC